MFNYFLLYRDATAHLIKHGIVKDQKGGLFGTWQDDVSEGHGLTFNLRTEEAAILQDNDRLVAQYQASFAQIIKRIKAELSIHGYRNAVIEEVFLEVTPGMYSSSGNVVTSRQAMFTIDGQYKLFSDRGTV